MSSTTGFAVRTSILAALGVAFSGQALAQAAASAADDLEEIVVTGSSIKGVAPVGSNLVTVGREEIEDLGAQTVQQILKTVPSVVGLQSAGQGAYGSFDGAGTNAPTIHGLGASASNSTLVLLNGRRVAARRGKRFSWQRQGEDTAARCLAAGGERAAAFRFAPSLAKLLQSK